MDNQERGAAIVGLIEEVYLKDVITDLIPVPTVPTIPVVLHCNCHSTYWTGCT
jgi:hypothetical protein